MSRVNGLTPTVNPQLAKIEGHIGSRSLRKFVELAWPVFEPGRGFVSNWHIDAICDHLQAVSDGTIKRLIINIPPRSSKSSIVAVAWPCWDWIKTPHRQFMFSSYAMSLSLRDSVKCRRLLESPWFKARWPHVEVMGDQNTKIRFDNTANGYRLATSVDGALTGEGGDIVAIDDPHNAKEAESDTVRQGVLDWYDFAMSTRLNDPKTGAFVIIMQRLHENDLTGHILAKETGWDTLCLPMRYEKDHPVGVKSSLGFVDPRKNDGDLLWPERFGEKEVASLERSMGSYGTSGQLQQRPSPAGGGIFKREWIRYFDDEDGWYTMLPSGRRMSKDRTWRVITADLALSTRESADFTVAAIWDIGEDSTLFLIDLWRMKAEAPDVEDNLRSLVSKHRPVFIGVEKAHYGTALVQKFRRDGLPVRELIADRDKVTRARRSSIEFENGRVYFRRGAPWLDLLESELLTFPNAKHDDQVDAITYGTIKADDNYTTPLPYKPKYGFGTFGEIVGLEEALRAKAQPNDDPFR